MISLINSKIQRIASIKNETLSQWLFVFLIILSAWMGAGLFWQINSFFNQQTIQAELIPGMSPTSRHKKLASAIIKNHLFGNAAKSQPQPSPDVIVEDAPETRLNLKLRGIYASDDPKLSNAIIENGRGQQDLYFIGEKIPGERNLSISKVMKDKIILMRNGNFETLTMEDFGSKVSAEPRRSSAFLPGAKKTSRRIDKRHNQQLTRQLANIRNKMVNDPKSLVGLMNVKPVTQNGQFKGFKVSPGRNASLFARSGLRRNDVVTSVNGIVLDDPSKALSLLDELKNAQELSIELERGNQPLSLVFSLNDNKK